MTFHPILADQTTSPIYEPTFIIGNILFVFLINEFIQMYSR